jgi:hypothetical protein
MALTGIDTQISVSRTAEFSKDLTNIQRRSELMQDFMSLQRKAVEEAQKHEVLKIESKDEVQITRDGKGTGRDGYEGRKKEKTEEEGEKPEEPKQSEGSRIDILV